ncbi:hypothetical protein NMY22_g9798 [Coprinellus aureogranulatus]|nr:hypothetical protein NMY22_g9798 [Coprinellus aureogranulatus]
MADEPLATCSAAFWSYNSLSQSPCVVGTALWAACNPTVNPITALLPDEVYIGPRKGYDTPCTCSSVVYSLISACAWCQNRDFISWSDWSANCTEVFSGVFPEEIPRGVAVPAWAYMDVTVTGFWEPPAAQVYPGAESVAPAPTSTVATPSPTTPTVTPPVQQPPNTPSPTPNSTVAGPSLGNPNPNKAYRTGGRVNALCALFAAAVFRADSRKSRIPKLRKCATLLFFPFIPDPFVRGVKPQALASLHGFNLDRGCFYGGDPGNPLTRNLREGTAGVSPRYDIMMAAYVLSGRLSAVKKVPSLRRTS